MGLSIESMQFHFYILLIGVVGLQVCRIFVNHLQKLLTLNIVSGMQGLVDRMKEYDLDTRAGLLICAGSDLRICYMDSTLSRLLGNPQLVDDILPMSMRAKHRQTVSRYLGSRSVPLPDSLNHPLRNVPILTKDQETINGKVIIGKFQFFSQIILRDIYYVVIQPSESAATRKPFPLTTSLSERSTASTEPQHFESTSQSPSGSQRDVFAEKLPLAEISDSESSEGCGDRGSDCFSMSDAHGIGAVSVYGLGAASYIGRGLVPATERYSQATVLYVDIVDFTRHCMVKGLDEISGWMTRIHSAIDELLEKHAIRKVETRGDCCICVSGTNFVGGEHGSSRDLSSTQATRMLSFGHDLGLALSAIEGTEVRMGMATGSVVLTHISHGGDALPAKYIYGDTVNVSCRMEQTGRVGAVQLCESAARAYAEERSMAVPPLATRHVKGKGAMKTTFYDYVASKFC